MPATALFFAHSPLRHRVGSRSHYPVEGHKDCAVVVRLPLGEEAVVLGGVEVVAR